MTTQTHSPLPWRIDSDPSGDGTLCILCGPVTDNRVVCAMLDVSDTDEANAQLICTAANAHAALVEALEGIACLSATLKWHHSGSWHEEEIDDLDRALDASRAALLLARGQK